MTPIEIGKNYQVVTASDDVVIPLVLEDLPGGRSLDVTGIAEEILYAGRIIIEETATGDLKPQAIAGGVYTALPGAHTYKGVLIATVEKAKPFASVMVRGRLNNEAAQNVHGLPPVLPAAIAALPLIRIAKD